MENDIFTIEELHELEALEIRGGNAPGGYEPMAQPSCSNGTDGCGGNVTQPNCSNNAATCGCTPHGTQCLQQPNDGCIVSHAVCSHVSC